MCKCLVLSLSLITDTFALSLIVYYNIKYDKGNLLHAAWWYI